MISTSESEGPSPAEPNDPVESSVTQHKLKIGARELRYTATCGWLELREDTLQDGKIEGRKARAKMFFVAYTMNEAAEARADAGSRPVSFCFNGGPGSSAVFLHLGLLGPNRVELNEEGYAAEPTGQLTDNGYSLIDASDLVFIDPIGTGFSRMADGEKVDEFHEYKRDIESIGEFVRLYCSRYHRWASPKYLIGESYGSLRAVGMASHLLERHGMYLHGLMLISCVLDYQHVRFDPGNDLPHILFLPTYAAIAWHHRLLAPALQRLELPQYLGEVEAFAGGEYAEALFLGTRLEIKRRKAIAKKLAGYTGLSTAYVERANLRIEMLRYCKELLRERGLTVGRLDGRYTGSDRDCVGERCEYDAAFMEILGPFSAAINQYLREDLGCTIEGPYEAVRPFNETWRWGEFQNRYTSVSQSLRKVMTMNPTMRVLVANGYYDLATPHFAADYALDHLELSPAIRRNLSVSYFQAGHMMYTHRPSLERLALELRHFVRFTIPQT